jgi:hypothetical protein
MILDQSSTRSGNVRHRSGRRGYGLIDLTLSVVLLLAAMASMVKLIGWVGAERRQAERRQWASQELSNALERIVSEPFDRVTSERARSLLAEITRQQPLVSTEYEASVTDDASLPVPARRVSLTLRWKTRSGEWDAPVRLVAWVTKNRGGPGS